MSKRKKRIDFRVHLTTEYGLGLADRKAHLGNDAEETFMNIWKSFPKNYDRRWVSVEFEFDGVEYEISSHTFRENQFDFWSSVESNDTTPFS